jgi:hypothetical protein
MSTRETSVAGQFYPSNATEIRSMIQTYNTLLDAYFEGNTEIQNLNPRAVIVPHAGYIYSGFTANIALRLLENSDVKRIVVIGPSHRVYLKGTSISQYDSYATPLGSLPIDKFLVDTLKEKFSFTCIPEAHHEHSTEVQLPLIKAYKPDVSVVELVYGDEDPNKLADVINYLLEDTETAVVISTDLSHYYDINKANKLDTICLNAIKHMEVKKLYDGCEACGKIGLAAMLLSAKERALKPVLLDYRTSADTSGDNSQVVGYMSAAFVQNHTVTKKKEILLQLARFAISEVIGKPENLNVDTLIKDNPWLEEERASFVTITIDGDKLRGCIGSLIAHRKLYLDVIHNAKSAAMHDPRFPPLTLKEFEQIKIEISLLTHPESISYDSPQTLKSKIRVGIDGVIIKNGTHQATFLPQVWEELPNFEVFFSHLCQKAGMSSDCLKNMPEILVYQVEKYKEA